MRNKHLLLVFVAMLGLAFVYPTSLSAQKDKKKKEKKKKTFSAQTHFYETVDCLFYPFLSRGDLLFMPFQGDSLPIIAAGVRSACIYAAREDGRRR